MSIPSLLVTGASGHLGSAALTYLLDTLYIPAERIVATTRTPAKAQALSARGVEVRAADFDDARSLDRAFAGVDRLLLISTDALEWPGRRRDQHVAAIAAARRTGVRHVVYTSMPKADTSPITIGVDHRGTEQALAESGLSTTVLRNNWYFENLLHGLPAAIASGTWYSAAGAGRTGYVSRHDCARVAAVALATEALDGHTYDVTGASALTHRDVAAAVNRAFGTALTVVDVTDAQLTARLVGAGLPPAVAAIFTEFDTTTRDGGLDVVSDVVLRWTKSAPDSLSDFLTANREALVSRDVVIS